MQPGIKVAKVHGRFQRATGSRPGDLHECGPGSNEHVTETPQVLFRYRSGLSRSGPAFGAAVLTSSRVTAPPEVWTGC